MIVLAFIFAFLLVVMLIAGGVYLLTYIQASLLVKSYNDVFLFGFAFYINVKNELNEKIEEYEELIRGACEVSEVDVENSALKKYSKEELKRLYELMLKKYIWKYEHSFLRIKDHYKEVHEELLKIANVLNVT